MHRQNHAVPALRVPLISNGRIPSSAKITYGSVRRSGYALGVGNSMNSALIPVRPAAGRPNFARMCVFRGQQTSWKKYAEPGAVSR